MSSSQKSVWVLVLAVKAHAIACQMEVSEQSLLFYCSRELHREMLHAVQCSAVQRCVWQSISWEHYVFHFFCALTTELDLAALQSMVCCAGKPSAAWELYLQQETTQQSLELLHLIANECYQAGFFFPAARAFGVLEQLHPAALYWQAKQGACVGTLQMVIAGKETPDSLRYSCFCPA